MPETKPAECLLHTRQKAKGKEKATERGIRLMKQEKDFSGSDQYYMKQNNHHYS